jgi:hypothetical protein
MSAQGCINFFLWPTSKRRAASHPGIRIPGARHPNLRVQVRTSHPPIPPSPLPNTAGPPPEMPQFFRRTFTCFYCNTPSAQKRSGDIRKWQCESCDAVNYLDEVRPTGRGVCGYPSLLPMTEGPNNRSALLLHPEACSIRPSTSAIPLSNRKSRRFLHPVLPGLHPESTHLYAIARIVPSTSFRPPIRAI